LVSEVAQANHGSRDCAGLSGSAGIAAFATPAALDGGGKPGCEVQADYTPAGTTAPAPFLKLPMREKDGKHSLYVTQGWVTSPDEETYDGGVTLPI
jgi:hypothetical protein